MTTVEQDNVSTMKQPFSPTIEKSLDDIIKNEGFIKHKKYERAISTNGGNYLGDLFEVDIKGKTPDGDKETNLFIKRIKSNNGFTFLSVQDIQNREILAYRELYELCKELMDEVNIPESERFHQPKCYDANKEALIFENLAVKGFKTLDRTQPISLQFAELAIKQLAKFHGLSFAVQTRRPEYFNSNIKTLKNPYNYTIDWLNMMKELLEICSKQLNENGKQKLQAAFSVIMDTDKRFAKPWRCLCHGDYRANNMLIKEEDGSIVDIVAIDFQLFYYGNPMNDFMYFLIVHSDQEFRRKHMLPLKELYYKTLKGFLSYFNIEVANVYPREAFDTDFKERLIFGLYSTIVVYPFLFASDQSVPDINELANQSLNLTLQDGAKERIQGIIDDYINWGII